jgi:MFS family permease
VESAADASVNQSETFDVAAVQRRTVGVLSSVQVFSGVAVAGSIPAGALIAASIGGEQVAGLAQTAGVLGAALLALPLARLALTRGRRRALSTGYGIALLGAVAVVFGGAWRNLPLVLLGCLLVGVASASGYQSRYAAIDLAQPDHRARQLSLVVWAGTIGAVLGPNLLNYAGNIALAVGLPQLTGPYLMAALMLLLGVGALLLFLRPDPYLLSRSIAAAGQPSAPQQAKLSDGFRHLRTHVRAMLGVASVSLGHVVMVMVMVMTPVHMAHVDVSLQVIGFVISVHVLGMYALSPVVGWLVDKLGRIPMMLVGSAILLMACGVAGTAAPDAVPQLAVGLFLLGLGWSCTLIAGSTLLTDDLDQADRPSVQGLSDLIMNLSAAVGGVIAGVIVAYASYGALCVAAVVPIVALVIFALVVMRRGIRVD